MTALQLRLAATLVATIGVAIPGILHSANQAPVAKVTLRLSFKEGAGPVKVDGGNPFFIPSFSADGKLAGGFQTDIRSAMFDVTAVDLKNLMLASQGPHQVYVDIRAVKQFIVTDQYLVVPSGVGATSTQGPFVTLTFGDKALEGPVGTWQVSVDQKGRLTSGTLDRDQQFELTQVGMDPARVTIKNSTTSRALTYAFVPVVRAAVRGLVSYRLSGQ